MPTDSTWVNVFQFTTHPTAWNGDRFPALFIRYDGFYVCHSYNQLHNQCTKFLYDLGTWHRMIIKQYKSCGKYWYEVILDDAVQLRIENKFPESLIDVKLYAGDPWTEPMTSDIGTICDESVGGMSCST